MTKRAPKLIASAFLVVTLATACGGGGRPSQDEIADGISGTGDVPSDVADCMAEVVHDSDLSDEAVQAIADGDEDYEPSGDDEQASEDVAGEFLECAGDMDLPEMPDLEDLETPSP